jgi:CPA1 family monovalent cation:H+ antiporter
MLHLAAALITLSALFSFINQRYFKLPTTIGLMFIALVFSLVVFAMGKLGLGGIAHRAEILLRGVNLPDLLMHGMLSLLLFAGALHININDLLEQKWTVGLLATVGTLISTLLVGALIWLTLSVLRADLSFIYCLVFGALISPTDPIAVLGVLKSLGAPKGLEIRIAGESLFNDGIGVVLFVVILDIAASGPHPDVASAVLLFVREAAGGILYGLLLGYAGYQMLRRVDNYQVEVLITLALVMGGYALATDLEISGPIAMVVSGLLIGNHGRRFAMSQRTREHLDTFWELVDEILNAVLFMLIGLEILVLTFTAEHVIAGLVAIPVVLIARAVSVSLPVAFLRFPEGSRLHVIKVLTWGGLRGGIPVALALSLPAGPEREVLIVITYVVVVFSVIVQGLTIGRVVRSGASCHGSGEAPG